LIDKFLAYLLHSVLSITAVEAELCGTKGI
jgi:hypothetical protein